MVKATFFLNHSYEWFKKWFVYTNVLVWGPIILIILNKSREMIQDFRRNKNKSITITTMEETVEVAEEDKCLGVHLHNRLAWGLIWKAVYKKGQNRKNISWKLRSFGFCSTMLHIFYTSVKEIAISSAINCKGSSIRAKDLGKFSKQKEG